MRWFSRDREPEEAAPDRQAAGQEEADRAKREAEGQIGEHLDRIRSLREEIRAGEDSLGSVTGRLKSVREEYDAAVAGLMSTKKEINEGREQVRVARLERMAVSKETDAARAQLADVAARYEEGRKRADETERAASELAGIMAEIGRSAREHESLRGRVAESQSVLDRIESKKAELDAQMRDVGARLADARARMEGAGSEAADRPEDPAADRDPPEHKNVVKAASAVVASMNQKLRIAEKELEVVKGLLEEERTAHAETVRQLDLLRAQDG